MIRSLIALMVLVAIANAAPYGTAPYGWVPGTPSPTYSAAKGCNSMCADKELAGAIGCTGTMQSVKGQSTCVCACPPVTPSPTSAPTYSAAKGCNSMCTGARVAGAIGCQGTMQSVTGRSTCVCVCPPTTQWCGVMVSSKGRTSESPCMVPAGSCDAARMCKTSTTFNAPSLPCQPC